MKPTLTLPEAAKFASKSRRAMLRWLRARVHEAPGVLSKAPGERVWSVQREGLKRLLGATDEDVDLYDQLRADVDDLKPRVRHVEVKLEDVDERVSRLERARPTRAA